MCCWCEDGLDDGCGFVILSEGKSDVEARFMWKSLVVGFDMDREDRWKGDAIIRIDIKNLWRKRSLKLRGIERDLEVNLDPR